MKTKFSRFATHISVALVIMSAFVACDESDGFQDGAPPTPQLRQEMAYVVNQGSM